MLKAWLGHWLRPMTGALALAYGWGIGTGIWLWHKPSLMAEAEALAYS